MTVSTHSLVNQVAATMGVSWYTLVTALLSVGWTQQGSGDGTTFSNSAAGPVVSGGTGTGGLDGTNRWVRLRDPSGNREIIIKRESSASVWSLYYSYSARFTGGSPGASARPTATDEVTIISSGNFNTSALIYTHAVVEDTAINGVWGFWLIRTIQSTSTRADFICCDPLSSRTDESRYASLGSVIDPCVWHAFQGTASPAGSSSSLSVTMQLLYSPTLSTRTLIPIICARFGTNNGSGNTISDASGISAGGMGANDYDGGDDIIAVRYMRFLNQGSGNPGLFFGLSHHLSEKTIIARNYPDVVQHPSSDLAWVYYNGFAIPWPKGTTPSP